MVNLLDCVVEAKKLYYRADLFILNRVSTEKWCPWPDSNRHAREDNRF